MVWSRQTLERCSHSTCFGKVFRSKIGKSHGVGAMLVAGVTDGSVMASYVGASGGNAMGFDCMSIRYHGSFGHTFFRRDSGVAKVFDVLGIKRYGYLG